MIEWGKTAHTLDWEGQQVTLKLRWIYCGPAAGKEEEARKWCVDNRLQFDIYEDLQENLDSGGKLRDDLFQMESEIVVAWNPIDAAPWS